MSHTFHGGTRADSVAHRAALIIENNKLVDLFTKHSGTVVSDQGLAGLLQLLPLACSVPDFDSMTVRHIARLEPSPVTLGVAAGFLKLLHTLNVAPAPAARARPTKPGQPLCM